MWKWWTKIFSLKYIPWLNDLLMELKDVIRTWNSVDIKSITRQMDMVSASLIYISTIFSMIDKSNIRTSCHYIWSNVILAHTLQLCESAIVSWLVRYIFKTRLMPTYEVEQENIYKPCLKNSTSENLVIDSCFVNR